jgi:hypothetical protein
VQSCGVDLWVLCVLNGSLNVSTHLGLAIAIHVSVQCAANCNDCWEAGAGKCNSDYKGCFGGYGITLKSTCAKVWCRFGGVVCAQRYTLNVSNVSGLAISFATSSCVCCTQLPSMCLCSVRRAVSGASKLEPASATLSSSHDAAAGIALLHVALVDTSRQAFEVVDKKRKCTHLGDRGSVPSPLW